MLQCHCALGKLIWDLICSEFAPSHRFSKLILTNDRPWRASLGKVKVKERKTKNGPSVKFSIHIALIFHFRRHLYIKDGSSNKQGYGISLQAVTGDMTFNGSRGKKQLLGPLLCDLFLNVRINNVKCSNG